MEKKSLRKKNHTPLKEELKNEIITLMVELHLWKEDLIGEIPTFWDVFKNFVIFNEKFFADQIWSKAGPTLWERVSMVFSGKSIALQGRIHNDDFRSPNTKVILGDSPWVEYLDNGITYTWNCKFTMFCTGNIPERHRIAKLNCEEKVVVDMFAGIGYFTLPYLVHARAKHVIACEWNPVSVEALKLNLIKNKVDNRCTVFEGDVSLKCPRRMADHVNMGLIPSCEQYWPVAAEILKSTGGIVHVHGNVTSFFGAQQKGLVDCVECSYLLKRLSVEHNNTNSEMSLSDFKISILDENLTIDKFEGESRCVSWKKMEWFVWSVHVAHRFCQHLYHVNKYKWTVVPKSLRRVKSYAPHVDHIVLDIHCYSEGNTLQDGSI